MKKLIAISLLSFSLLTACNNSANTLTMDNLSNYLNYSEEAVQQSIEDGKITLLFFHADWCPTCKVAEKNFIENNADIPEEVRVIKTSYDDEKALKQKYEVTIQHTFVQLDENQEEVKKWVGGDIPEIKQQLGL